ncbi:hypothetical protein BDW02DRAFT_635195 [Decorospora gaudefroyi]|uniref:F-box domain-containing protein n=1 Tax=Decorospora gaudefroyi TaxID=184978 RepID=A0A6A5JVJ2_9PLEO|nr:hypothetical protein BDW02DRAFT_635195 [Decorospora gaudefroyi]
MANNMSPEEYKELGRRYYKLKQYEKAAETFTNGIEACPTASLYDHRAATYDKLENLNAAVKDGREMIRLDKKDVKGYLRTASVLEKMEKPETALGIYKYGMKNVPVGDKNFKLLQKLHDKLTRKLSPATAIDPFTVLPVELAEMILEYLPFRHMVNCMRVSRGWRDYLSKLPQLWMDLDLSGARKPVPRAFVNTAFKRSQYRMTRVTVHRFEHIQVISNLAKAAKALAELQIISLPHMMSASLIDIATNVVCLTKLVIHPKVTLDSVVQILRVAPVLKHVTFHTIRSQNSTVQWTRSLDQLESLDMFFVDKTPANILSLRALFLQTRSLQCLTLSNLNFSPIAMIWPGTVSELPPLTNLVLKSTSFKHSIQFPVFPPTLQRLVLDPDGPTDMPRNDSDWLQSALPELTHLSLSNSEWTAQRLGVLLDLYWDDDGNTQKLRDAKPLQHLSVRGIIPAPQGTCFFKGPASVFSYSPRFLTKALESLDLATLAVDDDEVEHLLTNELGLRSIDLSWTNITGASIKMLADQLPMLKSIKADHCVRINGRDAIHYAQRKGIHVSYQMGELKGGRKIRYG